MSEITCKCEHCPAHARGMIGAKCCAGIDHNKLLLSPRTPKPKRTRNDKNEPRSWGNAR